MWTASDRRDLRSGPTCYRGARPISVEFPAVRSDRLIGAALAASGRLPPLSATGRNRNHRIQPLTVTFHSGHQGRCHRPLERAAQGQARCLFAHFGAGAGKWQVYASQPPSRCAQAKQTMPTGFSGVPPVGPAMPVMATAESARLAPARPAPSPVRSLRKRRRDVRACSPERPAFRPWRRSSR